MKLTTTLNRIRDCDPCKSGWEKLLKHLGRDFDRDAEINLLTILESNGVSDMLWALRATVQDSRRAAALMAIAFAEWVLPVFEKAMPGDCRPRKATEAAKGFLDGTVSHEELEVCRASAYSAAIAAEDLKACTAAHAAKEAAYASANATLAFAYAARAATYAAYAAEAAARAADCKKTAISEQASIIRSILES